MLGSTLLLVAAVLLLLTERHPPLQVIFEAVSAFATAGLSTGITAELSPQGRLLMTLAMFVGRIGPITLALALATRIREVSIERPEERVMIG
jgi:trk system potassium uptake protein TrkH